MRYEVINAALPYIEFTLDKDESVFSQTGNMIWKDSDILIKVNKLEEKEPTLSYCANSNDNKIAFSGEVPGDIMAIKVSHVREIIIQKSAFLCAEQGLSIGTSFKKKFDSSLFGRDGFSLQRVYGRGQCFLNVGGGSIIKDLKVGETLDVSSGSIVAFDASVDFAFKMVPGVKNILLGNEGLYFIQLTGPGKVILQTHNFIDFSEHIGYLLRTFRKGKSADDGSLDDLGSELIENSAKTATNKLTDMAVSKIVAGVVKP